MPKFGFIGFTDRSSTTKEVLRWRELKKKLLFFDMNWYFGKGDLHLRYWRLLAFHPNIPLTAGRQHKLLCSNCPKHLWSWRNPKVKLFCAKLTFSSGFREYVLSLSGPFSTLNKCAEINMGLRLVVAIISGHLWGVRSIRSLAVQSQCGWETLHRDCWSCTAGTRASRTWVYPEI